MLLSLGDAFDLDTFKQIVDIDDEDAQEFSATIVFDYFNQAEETFRAMDAALERSDLLGLSQLGEFFKGISAALGLLRVRDDSARIQQYGRRMDDDGTFDLDEGICVDRLLEWVGQLKSNYAEAEQALRSYFSQFEE
ncbi:histidine-phosphotransfer domain, HPT domain-containing protein [Aspergillus granulosus]|uniref:Histidine-phosphotransfer domain, HPT domain-containing protein n=1 Tax=Aspergillus granulosus TaxID=176169 RepID=A0ABR4GU07_9EURO